MKKLLTIFLSIFLIFTIQNSNITHADEKNNNVTIFEDEKIKIILDQIEGPMKVPTKFMFLQDGSYALKYKLRIYNNTTEDIEFNICNIIINEYENGDWGEYGETYFSMGIKKCYPPENLNNDYSCYIKANNATEIDLMIFQSEDDILTLNLLEENNITMNFKINNIYNYECNIPNLEIKETKNSKKIKKRLNKYIKDTEEYKNKKEIEEKEKNEYLDKEYENSEIKKCIFSNDIFEMTMYNCELTDEIFIAKIRIDNKSDRAIQVKMVDTYEYLNGYEKEYYLFKGMTANQINKNEHAYVEIKFSKNAQFKMGQGVNYDINFKNIKNINSKFCYYLENSNELETIFLREYDTDFRIDIPTSLE